jgi:hypothetical protein
MAILLPQTPGNILPEYAATSINFTRQMQNVSGVLVPAYTVQIAYERKDYLLNAAGEKIGVVSTTDFPMMPPGPIPSPDLKHGNIWLSSDQVNTLFAEVPATGKVIGEVIADMADALIHADLVARGIITA